MRPIRDALERGGRWFIEPALPEEGRETAFAIYCRLPGGRLRMPSREELRRFCIRGDMFGCLVHRVALRPRAD